MEKIRKKSSGKWAGSVSLWLILCLACLLLLSGCQKKEKRCIRRQVRTASIRFIISIRRARGWRAFLSDGDDGRWILIGELAGADRAAPENPEYQAVLSDKVEFPGY